jgi:hypothetical protein
MSSALEQFRAQRDAADDVHRRLVEVGQVLRSIQEQVNGLAKNEEWLKLLSKEETWLIRAQDLVANVERFREHEMDRFWPAVWRRWVVAVAFALAAVAAAGGAYAWVARPYAAKVAAWVEFADALAHRVMKMTPEERRQLDSLMKWPEGNR